MSKDRPAPTPAPPKTVPTPHVVTVPVGTLTGKG